MVIDQRLSTESQAEPYSFTKQKLRKSLSYPLKRSLLDAALRSSSVYSAVWYVFYSGRQFGHTVLDAHFSPEQYSYAASGKVQVRIFAVPATERKITENLLITQGLPILCQWLAKGQREGNAWRGFGHRLTIERHEEGLRCTEE